MDVYLPPTELLSSRRAEAAVLAETVLKATSRIVILYGPADTGKSTLVRELLIPAIAERQGADTSVLYGSCAPTLPTEFVRVSETVPADVAFRGANVIVLDHFERVLDLPREERREALDALFAKPRRGAARWRLVLVADERQLNGLYALEAYDADATRTMHQLRPYTVAEAIETLRRHPHTPAPRFGPELIGQIADDCVALSAASWWDTMPLVRLVYAWAVERVRKTNRLDLEKRDYEHAGGARAILRTHIAREIERVEEAHPGDGEVARFVLEHLMDRGDTLDPPDLPALTMLLGVDAGDVERVVDALTRTDGLLRKKFNGALRIVPPQARVLIEEERDARRPEIQRAHRLLTDGFREWELSGCLLPAYRFHEVHAQRRYLHPNRDESRFLLRCALLQGGPPSAGAAFYWLQRVADRADRLEVLLRSTFHDDWNVRRRAVQLLERFEEPDVAFRLREVATTDDDERVRQQAIRSLRTIGTDVERRALLDEVSGPTSPYLRHAVEALAAFPHREVIEGLKRIVEQPTYASVIREAAIRTLAALETTAATDALIEISLRDKDREDRDAAAKALGSVRDPALARYVFDALGSKRGPVSRTAPIAFAIVATLCLAIGLVLFASVITVGGWLVGPGGSIAAAGGYLAASMLLLLPAARMLRRLQDSTSAPSLRARVGTTLLFLVNALTALPVVHGLAHFAVRHRRTAATLLAIELVSLVFGFLAAVVLADTTSWLRFTLWLLSWIAASSLFVGSYLYDVLGVWVGRVVWRRASMRRMQRHAIHQHLLANSVAAEQVAEALVADVKPTTWSPKRLLRRYGTRIQPAQLVGWLDHESPVLRGMAARALSVTKGDMAVRLLEASWPGADSARRTIIFRILCKHPNERAAEALQRIAPTLSRWRRIRANLARWTYPVMIWPRSARYGALALLPTLGILLYDGYKVHTNSVWSLLVQVAPKRLGGWPFEEGRTAATMAEHAAIVEFVARPAYAEQAAPHLLDLLRQTPYDSLSRPLHAALVSALATLPPDTSVHELSTWRAALSRAMDVYEKELGAADTTHRLLAVGVLSRMAMSTDSSLAQRAAGRLVGYIATDERALRSETVTKKAIAGLAELRFDRSLPLLDSLVNLRARTPASSATWLTTELTAEMRRAAHLAVDSVRSSENAEALASLLQTIRTLKQQGVITQEIVGLDQRSCDRNHDGACDWQDEARSLADGSPDAEIGYRVLVDAYVQRDSAAAAVRALEGLVAERPRAIWPRKALASVLHETIALRDAAAFDSSYAVMRTLRALPEYRALRQSDSATFVRIELDYVEVAFSAQRFTEVDSLTRALTAIVTTPTQRYNTALFAFLSAVMRGNRPLAQHRLALVEDVLRAQTPEFSNDWDYPGTQAFLDRSSLPGALRRALLALCTGGTWSSDVSARRVQDNRNAIARLE